MASFAVPAREVAAEIRENIDRPKLGIKVFLERSARVLSPAHRFGSRTIEVNVRAGAVTRAPHVPDDCFWRNVLPDLHERLGSHVCDTEEAGHRGLAPKNV